MDQESEDSYRKAWLLGGIGLLVIFFLLLTRCVDA
jgi:hypothetical protein